MVNLFGLKTPLNGTKTQIVRKRKTYLNSGASMPICRWVASLWVRNPAAELGKWGVCLEMCNVVQKFFLKSGKLLLY